MIQTVTPGALFLVRVVSVIRKFAQLCNVGCMETRHAAKRCRSRRKPLLSRSPNKTCRSRWAERHMVALAFPDISTWLVHMNGSGNDFASRMKGSFRGILPWSDLDALWEKVRAAPDGWYASLIGETPATTPMSAEELDRFGSAIAGWPEVMECYLMTGQFDYLLRVVCADLAAYESFLRDKLGEQIFPSSISIIDDPFRPRGLASRPFDAEGLAAARAEGAGRTVGIVPVEREAEILLGREDTFALAGAGADLGGVGAHERRREEDVLAANDGEVEHLGVPKDFTKGHLESLRLIVATCWIWLTLLIDTDQRFGANS